MNNEKSSKQDLFDLLDVYEAILRGESNAYLEEEDLLRVIDYYDDELFTSLALEAANLALELFPFSLDIHLRKADLLLICEQEELALMVLDEANAISPGDLQIEMLKIQALSSLGIFEEAYRSVQRLKDEASPGEELSQIYLAEAMIYEQEGQYENMFYSLKAALLEDPSNHTALEQMWFCTELSKLYRESIEFHEQLLELDAYSALAWYNLGHAYGYFGQYNEAIAAFEYAYLIDEKFEYAYRDCAEMCFELRQYPQALKHYSELLGHFEVDSDILLRIGQCYQFQGNFPLAKIFYEKAILLDSLNDEVFYQLGECFLQEEKIQKAIRYFQKAIRLDDRREEYAAALGEAYVKLDEPESAAPWFELATEIAPETTRYWLRYAQFLLEYGYREEALTVLDEAEEYAVGAELNYCRVIVLLEMGRRQEALFLLGMTLDEDYYTHRSLFDLKPELREDREIQAVIATFLPYKN